MNESRKTLWIGMAILLVAAGISGGLQAWMSDVDLAAALQISPVEAAANEAGIPVVRTEEMKQIVDAGSHLLLDARSLQEYDQGHLPGALSLPVKEFETVFPQIAPMLGPLDPLIVYCSGVACDDALLLAQRLEEAGFSEVSLFLDGWQGWTP